MTSILVTLDISLLFNISFFEIINIFLDIKECNIVTDTVTILKCSQNNQGMSTYPPNAGNNLPWRIQFKSHPPLWRVKKLGSAKVKRDNLRKQIELETMYS